MDSSLSAEAPPKRRGLAGLLVIAGTILLFLALHFGVDTRVQQWETRALGAEEREAALQERVRLSERRAAELASTLQGREADWSRREAEMAEREQAIGGRESAAAERTQSSLQGLLIQQQLVQTLEGLKASLPDLAPEVEKLTRDHARLKVENERLETEIGRLQVMLARERLNKDR